MSLSEPICDLCHQTESVLLFRANVDIENTEPGLFYSTYPYPAEHFDIIRCNTCSLVRSRLQDDPELASKFSYNQIFEPDPIDEKNQTRITRIRAKRITGKLIPGNTLLDINCATGLFAAETTRLGWKVTGIDPSSPAIFNARRHSPWSRFLVEHVDSAIFPAGSFDTITMWNGLDINSSPRKTLERITSWLLPGGQLILKLPNINSFEARLMGSEWPFLKRNRQWYFSPATITRLLNETGFNRVSIRPVKSYFTLKYVSTTLKQQKGWVRLLGHLINLPGPLGHISGWFGTGEMEITAQLKEIS